MKEIWDAYDRNEEKLGFDIVRGDIIPEGVYHMVCETIVRHKDGTILLMQRDWTKKLFPGAWEIGAGGSALKGETPLEGAKRELREESGVIAKELTPLYRVITDEAHSIYHGFLCITDCPKDSIILQPGETIAYKWVTKEEFVAFIDSEDCIGLQKYRMKDFVDSLR